MPVMSHISPPRLVIPSSSASPASTSNIHTGRPSLWSDSTERQLVRLYVYSTLKVEEILKIVFRDQPDECTPKKDSANKKLNALLDKEPRWLKPRTPSDMDRRFEQLQQSPTRVNLGAETQFTRPHSYSAPPPPPTYDDVFIKQETTPQYAIPMIHSTFPDPISVHGPSLFPMGNVNESLEDTTHRMSTSDDFQQSGMFSRVARRASRVSVSTTQTSDSIHRAMLDMSDCTEYMVRRVRHLVKRFTIKPNQLQGSMSPIPEALPRNSSWVDDSDKAPDFTNRVFPLPGDFLRMDELRQHQGLHCLEEDHNRRWCVCSSHDEIKESPWITARGLTPAALDALSGVVNYDHIAVLDAFGNSVLHLLAARQPYRLASVLRVEPCLSILNARNSANQTFLHVLHPSFARNVEALCGLIDLLLLMTTQSIEMDVTARDCFGRTFFHMFQYWETPNESARFILERYPQLVRRAKDAFGHSPAPTYTHVLMDLDPPQSHPYSTFATQGTRLVQREAKHLKTVLKAVEDPLLEDPNGRNGLHCLGMATLSNQNATDLSTIPATPNGRRRRRGQAQGGSLDSSHEKLNFRRELTEGLLDAGVDPNHYDHFGNTPLMAFAAHLPEDDDYKIGPEIIGLLLDRGADVNARSRAGETALHVAVRCGRKLAARQLYTCGANPNVRDAAGRSVLELIDVKVRSCLENAGTEYSYLEACRAWLSGTGQAVQHPTLMQEWTKR